MSPNPTTPPATLGRDARAAEVERVIDAIAPAANHPPRDHEGRVQMLRDWLVLINTALCKGVMP